MIIRAGTLFVLLTLILSRYTVTSTCSWDLSDPNFYQMCAYEYITIIKCENVVSYSLPLCYDQNFNLVKDYELVINVKYPDDNVFDYKDNDDLILYRQLSMTDGTLSTIPNKVYQMTQLRELIITTNKIVKINLNDFLPMQELNTLILANNMISVIDSNLISENNLTNLNSNCVTLTKLKKLDISFNKISSITLLTFEGLVQVESLDISHNKLSEVGYAFAKMPSLQSLNVSNNNLARLLEYNFITLTNLKTLNVESNNINSIDTDTFVSLTKLEVLNLANNKIGAITNQMFHRNLNMRHLLLWGNQIKSLEVNIFKHMKSLETLDLSLNDIDEMESRNLPNNLLYLNLSRNTRMKIHGNIFEYISTLNGLSLERVKVDITFENCNVSIETLELQSCGISDINKVHIFNVHNVKYLNLSMNEISLIDKDSFKINMPLLEILDLSLNTIKYIQPGSFLNLEQLTSLNLHGNYLSNVQYGVFNGPKAFSHINLSKNMLQTFDIQICPVVISKLSLDDNFITYLNFKELFSTKLDQLSIGGNRIPCKDLAIVKYSDCTEKFNQIVTAETFNYYLANVNGITCLDVPRDTTSMGYVSNTHNSYSPIIYLLANAINKTGISLPTIGENITKLESNIQSNNEKLTDISNQFATSESILEANEN